MLRALKVSYSDVGEGRVAVDCEKTQFFLNTLYVKLYINIRLIDEEQLLQLVTYRQDMHHSLKKCRHPGNWLPSLRDQKLRKQGEKTT